MAETLRRGTDVPDFDTYPAETPPSRQLEAGEQPVPLERTAAQVGRTAGKVVALSRKIREKMNGEQNRGTNESGPQLVDAAKERIDTAKERISDLTDAARAKAGSVADAAKEQTDYIVSRAREQAASLRHTARERAVELRQRARMEIYRARIRARQISRDYPFHVALGAGLLGLCLGIGLRLWRANRE